MLFCLVQPHEMMIGQKFIYRVSKASKYFTRDVNKVIKEQVVDKDSSFIPVEAMDKVVANDYKVGSTHSYVIYILNPLVPAAEGSQEDYYMKSKTAYWYLEVPTSTLF